MIKSLLFFVFSCYTNLHIENRGKPIERHTKVLVGNLFKKFQLCHLWLTIIATYLFKNLKCWGFFLVDIWVLLRSTLYGILKIPAGLHCSKVTL